MTTPKELKTKISAVQNTKKITKTMEMVATAKARKAVNKVNQLLIYSKKLVKLTDDIVSSSSIEHTLLKQYDPVTKVGILIVTANRGLCGGFNNNTLRLVQTQIQSWEEKGVQTEVHLLGKKAVDYFHFMGMSFHKSHTTASDSLSYEESSNIVGYFIQEFIKERLQHIEIISTRYLTASSQRPQVIPLLPLNMAINMDTVSQGDKENSKIKQKSLFIFEPSTEDILASLLSRLVRLTLFQCLLESAASEQIARRIAMKNATENASEIIRDMTLIYNRVRQAKITQEIAELVGGAAAIK